MMPIEVRVIQSKCHVITLTSKGVKYKLFQISFDKEGGVMVHFPYYKHSEGIAGKITSKPNATSAILGDNAKCTSHLIKYAHHAKGEAHFSQDGKIKTEIRNESLPIREFKGHIFSVMIQGIHHFKKAVGQKYEHGNNTERSTVHIDTGSLEFEALKFIAIWEPFEDLVKSLKPIPGKNYFGPQFIYKDPERPHFGFLLSPNPGNPSHGFVLSLRMSAINSLNKDEETFLVFIGGFEKNIKDVDPKSDYNFLGLIYPSKNSEELRKNIGSMDLTT